MLYIVTPCSRPQNLVTAKTKHPTLCNVGCDDGCLRPITREQQAHQSHTTQSRTGNAGHPLRNEFLELYADSFTKEDWVYYLDDDNVLHPKFIEEWSNLHSLDCSIVTWGQIGRLRPTDQPRVGNIDTACYMFKPHDLPNLRFEMTYEAGGTIR
jgi:hypothetical protein